MSFKEENENVDILKQLVSKISWEAIKLEME